MPYLIAILIPSALLALFLVLVAREDRTGRRVLPARRYALDTNVARVVFVMRHVNWSAFAYEITRSSIERILHDAAHGTLLAVRALERLLTKLVRQMRTSDTLVLPEARETNQLKNAAEFVKRSVLRSRKALKDTLER